MPCKYSNKSDTNYLHILHGPTLKIESKPKNHQEWGVEFLLLRIGVTDG
jgi:hypothetical protein